MSLVNAKLKAEAREAADIIGKHIGNRNGQRIGSHGVFKGKFHRRHTAVGSKHPLKCITVLSLFAGENVRPAGGETALTVPMRKQRTIVIGVTGYIEMKRREENLVPVRLDRCDLAGMLVDLDRDGGGGPTGAPRELRLSDLGGRLTAVDRLHFKGARLQPSVGGKKPVDAEITVMLALAEVAAVKEAVLGLDGVIRPFPHKSAHQLLVLVDQIPVRGDVPAGVAHGVGVFAKHEGAGLLGVIKHLFSDALDRRIHHTGHIHHIGIIILLIGPLKPLVVDGAGLVTGPDISRALKEGFAKGAFVPERPDDHAGAIFVPLHKCRMPIGNAGGKELVLGVLHPKSTVVPALAGAGTVHLKVGLVHYIKAVRIAKQVELGAVGIVRGPDGVDVQLLHQADILRHIRKADGGGGLAVEIVAIHALQLDGGAIDLEHLAVDADLTEADPLLDLFPACIKGERIKRGLLGRPGADARGGERGALPRLGNGLVAAKREADVHRALIEEGDDAVLAIDRGFDLIIGNMLFGAGKQIDASENAREAEFILAFKIGGNAPLQHQDIDGVLTVFQKRGDVELARRVGDLGIAQALPVDVEIKGGVNTLKVKIIPLAALLFKIKGAAVMPARILVGNVRQHHGEGIS